MNDNPKSLLESKTFWGLVIAMGTPLLAKHGIIVDTGGAIADLVALGGGLLALYGRFTATMPVTLLGK